MVENTSRRLQSIFDARANHTERSILIIGLVFVVTMLLAPKGIVGTIIEQWRSDESGSED